MVRSYEDVVAALRPAGNPALTRFTQAVQTHFEDACSQAVAARRAEPHLSQVQRSDRTGIPQLRHQPDRTGQGQPHRPPSPNQDKIETCYTLASRPSRGPAAEAATARRTMCPRSCVSLPVRGMRTRRAALAGLTRCCPWPLAQSDLSGGCVCHEGQAAP
jgi:hypothetical protein